MSGLLDAIHFVIGIACLIAAFRIVPSFQALIRLHPLTVISGTGFFILTGITQLGLAVHDSHTWVFAVAAYLQAICISTFLVVLYRDVALALKRLRLAFMAIRHHYQKDGDRVIAAITTALQGADGYRDRVTRN